jgi:RNA polymerase sigma factor (sigma-70 family)
MRDSRSDDELINGVLAGNQQSFAALVERYQKYAFTLAMKFVKNREEAEEIAQDCFVKAYKSLATFERKSKFSTWLYQIVYYTSMSAMRKKKMEKVSIDDEETFLQLESKESSFKADIVERKSKTEFLQLAMNELQGDDAFMLTLFYQSEQSLEEIAKITGYEENNVKVKLHRARHRLREKLEQILKHETTDLL